MFSERLENLIKAALQDGTLTEQEKASIIKRAQAEGEDIDEVDIYIQSLVQKKQQELTKEAQEAETARIVAQKKEREARMASELEEQKQRDHIMRKCPVCGGIIPALSNVCPHCQHVINSYETDEKMMEMIKKITAASERMEIIRNGELYFNKIEHSLSKKEYDRMSEQGVDDPNFELWHEEGWGYCLYEKFNYYFPMINELENLYGELPKVKDFLLNQKKKRLNLYASKFEKIISEGDVFYFAEANTILNTIISSYGSMPEAQALIPKYQNQLEKFKTKRIFKRYGCAVIIAIAIIFAFLFG